MKYALVFGSMLAATTAYNNYEDTHYLAARELDQFQQLDSRDFQSYIAPRDDASLLRLSRRFVNDMEYAHIIARTPSGTGGRGSGAPRGGASGAGRGGRGGGRGGGAGGRPSSRPPARGGPSQEDARMASFFHGYAAGRPGTSYHRIIGQGPDRPPIHEQVHPPPQPAGASSNPPSQGQGANPPAGPGSYANGNAAHTNGHANGVAGSGTSSDSGSDTGGN